MEGLSSRSLKLGARSAHGCMGGGSELVTGHLVNQFRHGCVGGGLAVNLLIGGLMFRPQMRRWRVKNDLPNIQPHVPPTDAWVEGSGG